jgi:hypothetical protein
MDDAYVRELLAHLAKQSRKPANRAEFDRLFAADIRQGYLAEVNEAWRIFASNEGKP